MTQCDKISGPCRSRASSSTVEGGTSNLQTLVNNKLELTNPLTTRVPNNSDTSVPCWVHHSCHFEPVSLKLPYNRACSSIFFLQPFPGVCSRPMRVHDRV